MRSPLRKMPPLPGQSAPRSIPTLSHVRDIEYYEGPLLAEQVDSFGHPWICIWRDKDESANRWLLFRTTPSDVTKYLNKRLSLRDLMCGGLEYFALDVRIDGTRAVNQLYWSEIPRRWFPSRTAFYDENLSPSADH